MDRNKKIKVVVAGSLNYDTMLFVDRFAPPKVRVRALARYLGGSGGNAATAAARFLGVRGTVIMVGAVGNDEVGRKHIDALRSEGIDTSFIVIKDSVESGQAFVAVNPSGETAIYSYYGANEALNYADVRPLLNSGVKPDAVLIMNPPIEVAEAIAGWARERGAKVVWDPGSLSHEGIDKLGGVIRRVDIIAPNKDELLSMTRATSVEEAVERLRQINPGLLVLSKEGINGSRLFMEDRVLIVRGIPTERLGLMTRSTSGCGDAYVGVFTAAVSVGHDFVDAMVFATCAATINASREGPRGSPRYTELVKYAGECRRLAEPTVI